MSDLIQLKASFQAIPPTALEEREIAYCFPLNALFFGTDDDGIQAGYLSGRSDDEWEQYLASNYSADNHDHEISRWVAGSGRNHLRVRGIASTTGGDTAVMDTDGRCKYFHWNGSALYVQVDAAWIGWYADLSDRRLKTNITGNDSPELWNAALEGLVAVPLVSFDWNSSLAETFDESFNALGVIAQDLEAINPELISTDPEGFKHINPNKCIVQLVAAIKGLNAKVEALQGQLSNETN